MSLGSKIQVTIQVGTQDPIELHNHNLSSFNDTNVRTNERKPGPGQSVYVDTKHASGTISFTVLDSEAVRSLAGVAGELATVTVVDGGESTSYRVNPMVSVAAPSRGLISFNVTGTLVKGRTVS